MQEKETNELEQELGSTHLADYNGFLEKHKDSMLSDSTSFSTYVKAIMREKGVTQQTAFLKADIPERYGYKLLSGEKHTRQRDIILRICYASDDALIMIAFNERPGSIIDVNALLKENRMETLRTSGMQE